MVAFFKKGKQGDMAIFGIKDIGQQNRQYKLTISLIIVTGFVPRL